MGVASDSEPPERLNDSRRASVLKAYLDRLDEIDSPIVRNPVAVEQTVHQAEAVLDDLGVADLSEPLAGLDRDTLADDRLSEEIGGTRANTGIHPLDSLEAATALFTVVMEQLVPPDADKATAISMSEVLHTAIMRRVGVASISYASFLLKKVHGSHLEERRRMARELHDRVAHEVGVGLQNLELHDLYPDDPERAEAKLRVAKESLREALDTVRALSAELGTTVGSDGLVVALTNYLKVTRPPDVDVRFAATGDDRIMPGTYSEEIYLVLREAVRNALLHGSPTVIEVRLEFEGKRLRGVVRDDGVGFEVAEVLHRGGGVGLTSMRERMELLGGALTLTSGSGGTTVEARVELLDTR